MDPTLLILALSTIAALAAALGVLPFAGRRRVPTTWLGWANALAAGMMLGAAYMLSAVEPGVPGVGSVGGSDTAPFIFATIAAIAGIAFTYWTHTAVGAVTTGLNQARAADPTHGSRILAVGFLHSASEGVAMAVAMFVDLRFGVLVALALAVHNIPEATVLASVLQGRGLKLGRIALLAIVTNTSQILLAVTVYSIVVAAPSTLIWAQGFAIGSLIQLVLLELLPESYREAGQTSIAVVTIVALGVVVLVQGFVS